MRFALFALIACVLFTGCAPSPADRETSAVNAHASAAETHEALVLTQGNIKDAQIHLAKVLKDKSATEQERDQAKAEVQALKDQAASLAIKEAGEKERAAAQERAAIAQREAEAIDRLRWYLRIAAVLCGLAGGLLIYEAQKGLGSVFAVAGGILFACVPLIGREWLAAVILCVYIVVPAAYGAVRVWMHGEKQKLKAKVDDAEHLVGGIMAKVPVTLGSLSTRAVGIFNDWWHRLHGDNHDAEGLANHAYGANVQPSEPVPIVVPPATAKA